MYQGTTPALTLNVSGIDLTGKTVYVTIRCEGYTLTKTGDSLAVAYSEGYSVVVVRLTQKETLMMGESKAEVQIRFIDENGNADATNKATFDVNDVLYHAVINYEGGEG